MIFPLCKWCFDINWHKFEKRWADVFQIYPNAIHFNPLQFWPSMPLLGFPVFSLSSSIVLNRYFHILVNSMDIWSVLKSPKIAWPSLFNLSNNSPLYTCLFMVSCQWCKWSPEVHSMRFTLIVQLFQTSVSLLNDLCLVLQSCGFSRPFRLRPGR